MQVFAVAHAAVLPDGFGVELLFVEGRVGERCKSYKGVGERSRQFGGLEVDSIVEANRQFANVRSRKKRFRERHAFPRKRLKQQFRSGCAVGSQRRSTPRVSQEALGLVGRHASDLLQMPPGPLDDVEVVVDEH